MVSPSRPLSRALAFYAWMARFRFMNYRAKIMVMAFIGTHIPLIALAVWFALQSAPDLRTLVTTIGVTLAATLAGTGFTLFVLDRLLKPVVLTSRALREYRQTRRVEPLPEDYSDEVGTLMADAGRTMRHLESTLFALEHVDEGTGLPNRRRFLQWIAARIARGERFAVAAVRFGNFQRIAETFDLARAERSAAEMARRLAERSDLGQQFARIDPSTFACVIDAHAEDWVAAATCLRAALADCAQGLEVEDVELRPVLNAGLAAHPGDAVEAGTLLDLAVAAAAQGADAATVVLHSPQARKAAQERFRLEQELRRAIRNDEFELHYQPVVDVAAGRAVGAEALIRWRHPERGMVPPGQFIAAAEASGLIEPIGLWVMRRACAQLQAWNAQGRAPLKVAINLSARQFLDPDLKHHVLDAVRAAGISPDQLEIELTETAAMADFDHSSRVFGALRDAGVGIAIDDFGSGYASMSYLRKLPFDKLKIDREFVTDVHRLRHAQAICGALIELSRGLGLRVLAEGAEAEDEVRYLAGRGCGLFQGYYFSRPVPAGEFERALDTPGRFILPAPTRDPRPAAAELAVA